MVAADRHACRSGWFIRRLRIVPLVAGTLLITLIAMLVAGPIGTFAAIYMAEYATPKVRAIIKPILEILAGVPTVVLGFFAALTVAPFIRGWGEMLGLDCCVGIGPCRRRWSWA